jgi:hypothetical protein
VIKAEHDLPGTEEGMGKRMGEGGAGGKVTQTMYAHVNKRILKKKGNIKKKKRIGSLELFLSS